MNIQYKAVALLIDLISPDLEGGKYSIGKRFKIDKFNSYLHSHINLAMVNDPNTPLRNLDGLLTSITSNYHSRVEHSNIAAVFDKINNNMRSPDDLTIANALISFLSFM